jgi:hypothetical protein
MRFLVFIFFACSCIAVFAQPAEPGAEAAALGGSYVVQHSVFSSRHNVAGLGAVERNAIGAGLRNNYLATNLNDFYLMAAFAQGKGRIGVDLYYFGIDAYQQGALALSYARPFATNWYAGVRISYAYNYIPQEEVNRQLLSADLGILGKLGNWRVGTSIQQFAQSQWQGRVDEHSPIIFRLGGGYFFTEQTCLTAELYKADNERADVRLGLCYAPAAALELRLGFGTLRPSFGFGLGIAFDQLQINLAATWHQQLGLSPLTDLVYAW